MTSTNRKQFTDAVNHGTSGYLFNDNAQLNLEEILQSQTSVTLELIYPSTPQKNSFTQGKFIIVNIMRKTPYVPLMLDSLAARESEVTPHSDTSCMLRG